MLSFLISTAFFSVATVSGLRVWCKAASLFFHRLSKIEQERDWKRSLFALCECITYFADSVPTIIPKGFCLAPRKLCGFSVSPYNRLVKHHIHSLIVQDTFHSRIRMLVLSHRSPPRLTCVLPPQHRPTFFAPFVFASKASTSLVSHFINSWRHFSPLRADSQVRPTFLPLPKKNWDWIASLSGTGDDRTRYERRDAKKRSLVHYRPCLLVGIDFCM